MEDKYFIETMAAMAAISSGETTFEQFWESMPKPLHKIENASATNAVLSFSALQLLPELQHHSIRLQMLSTLAFLYCRGHGNLPPETIGKAFDLVGRSLAATLEDPPEDAFCSSICSDRGEFLILEATDEGAGFFVQRLANIVQTMPNNEHYEQKVKAPVFALLALSDAALKRAKLVRNQEGGTDSFVNLTKAQTDRISNMSKALKFSNAELKKLGIDKNSLRDFDCANVPKEQIKNDTFGGSFLNFHPIQIEKIGVILLFPSLISTAVRGFILRTFATVFPKALQPALADEFRDVISKSPYGGHINSPNAVFSKHNGVWLTFPPKLPSF